MRRGQRNDTNEAGQSVRRLRNLPPRGICFSKEVSPTLKAGASGLQAPVVAIPYTIKIRSGCEGGGKGALIQEDKSATLSCNNDQTLFAPTQTENGEVIYLARKLTPTECASLQGFEKDWCALVPHKDSAEYKMWGNGMAYPCVLYIMQGIRGVLTERLLGHITKDDLLTRHSGENYDDLRQNRGGIT
nr:MAG TPA: C-5 cytosine-specific DNA methylase [Caudoviricetes sp.]